MDRKRRSQADLLSRKLECRRRVHQRSRYVPLSV